MAVLITAPKKVREIVFKRGLSIDKRSPHYILTVTEFHSKSVQFLTLTHMLKRVMVVICQFRGL